MKEIYILRWFTGIYQKNWTSGDGYYHEVLIEGKPTFDQAVKAIATQLRGLDKQALLKCSRFNRTGGYVKENNGPLMVRITVDSPKKAKILRI